MIDLEEHVQETQQYLNSAFALGMFVCRLSEGLLEILDHASHDDCELADLANSETFREEAELSRNAAKGLSDVIEFLSARKAKLLEAQRAMSEEH